MVGKATGVQPAANAARANAPATSASSVLPNAMARELAGSPVVVWLASQAAAKIAGAE